MCECQCEKKTRKVIKSYYLTSGQTKSCGCLRIEATKRSNTKHGCSKTSLYRIWEAMKRRVLNPNNIGYQDYGGRGIKICDEWLIYENFKNWAIKNGYEEGLSIERKNVNGDYCPENCCWIPRFDQGKNKRNTKWLEFKNERKTAKEWAKELGINYHTLMRRLNSYHWTVEKALTTPVKRR